MGSAPAHHNPRDSRAAHMAQLAGPPVDAKPVLMVPCAPIRTAVGCITQRRAPVGEGADEYILDGPIQSPDLAIVQRIGRAQRVESGCEEHLIGVDIAQSRQKPLVQ